jgi:hypothetical protein
MINFNTVELINAHERVGPVLLADVPESVLVHLKDQISKIKSNKFASKIGTMSHHLAGHLESQVKFPPKEEFDNFIFDFAREYVGLQGKTINSFNQHIAWLNFQKKHEYNPNHIHNGNLSYVIWIQVPFLLSDEDRVYNSVRSMDPANGRFEFTYLNKDLNLEPHRLGVDKSYEGKIVLFDSMLRHCVHPFYTSDDYRISIAGNIFFS